MPAFIYLFIFLWALKHYTGKAAIAVIRVLTRCASALPSNASSTGIRVAFWYTASMAAEIGPSMQFVSAQRSSCVRRPGRTNAEIFMLVAPKGINLRQRRHRPRPDRAAPMQYVLGCSLNPFAVLTSMLQRACTHSLSPPRSAERTQTRPHALQQLKLSPHYTYLFCACTQKGSAAASASRAGSACASVHVWLSRHAPGRRTSSAWSAAVTGWGSARRTVTPSSVAVYLT